MVRTRGFLILFTLTCLFLTGFMTEGSCQQNSETLQTPQSQPPAKIQRLPKRPDRAPSAVAGLEVVSDLIASPAVYTGPCPAPITIKGKIGVNRATIVQYRFIRSDNSRSEPKVLNFEKPGSQEVSDTWQFDDPSASPDFSGWQAIQFNYPTKDRSNVAFFKGTCTNRKRSSGPDLPIQQTGPQRQTSPQNFPMIPSGKQGKPPIEPFPGQQAKPAPSEFTPARPGSPESFTMPVAPPQQPTPPGPGEK